MLKLFDSVLSFNFYTSIMNSIDSSIIIIYTWEKVWGWFLLSNEKGSMYDMEAVIANGRILFPIDNFDINSRM